MSFDASTLLASFFVGSVGLVLVVYGKKMARIPHIAAGALMLVYPYFIPTALLDMIIFAALTGLLIGAVRLGY